MAALVKLACESELEKADPKEPPAIELRPLNDLENPHPAQPVEVPGDDDYTLS